MNNNSFIQGLLIGLKVAQSVLGESKTLSKSSIFIMPTTIIFKDKSELVFSIHSDNKFIINARYLSLNVYDALQEYFKYWEWDITEIDFSQLISILDYLGEIDYEETRNVYVKD